MGTGGRPVEGSNPNSASALRAKTKPCAKQGFTNSNLLAIYTLNEEPQPQVLLTFGFSNLKPAPSSVST